MANQVEQGVLSPWLQKIRMNKSKNFLNGTILDVGCGDGSLTKYSKPTMYFGYDIDIESLKKARESYPKFEFSNKIPDSRKFDSIVMLAVIEHISDPYAFVQNMMQYLNDRGRIIITTPHPFFDWIHTLGAKLGFFSSHASEEHEKLLNKNDIKQLIKDTNLNLLISKRFLFGANQLFVLEYNSCSKILGK